MAETKRYISKEELKTHSRVYNVSDWAKEHLGGSAPLLSLAGQDAIDAFVAYHPGFWAWGVRHTLCDGGDVFAYIYGVRVGWIGHDFGHYQVMMNRHLNGFAQVLSGNCLTELEDAIDGPDSMGQHPSPIYIIGTGMG
ncbi:hypothetical protein AAG906_035666 [Vitis piasezkii]